MGRKVTVKIEYLEEKLLFISTAGAIQDEVKLESFFQKDKT